MIKEETYKEISAFEFIEYINNHDSDKLTQKEKDLFKGIYLSNFSEEKVYFNIIYEEGKRYIRYNFRVFKFSDEWFIVRSENDIKKYNSERDYNKVSYFLCDTFQGLEEMFTNHFNLKILKTKQQK